MPDWKSLLFGPTKPADPPDELAATTVLGFGRTPGHTVDILEAIPHGGDLHLVVARVDGEPFRNYVPTGDIRDEEPHVQRRILARRVRQMHRTPPGHTRLTGRELGLP